jgi:acyl-[acyl-carrier-protein]-phospholipid O-acyltransferase/long-chain-fatty-acid--[acyl-carrier-protein] ligase
MKPAVPEPEDPGTIKPPASEVGVGWYATGDLVDMDEEGFLWVRGRLKRFAKIAGEMVSLDAVERVARHASPEHQHAASVQVVADLGESTVLFTTDASLTRGALHQSARKLGSHELAVSRSVVYVKELPMLGSGKTDYVALQALLSSESRPFVDRQLEARPLVSLGPAVPGAEAGIQGV